MNRQAFVLTAALLIAVNMPMRVAAQAVEGTWKLTYLSGQTEYDKLLVTLKTIDGKITGEVIESLDMPRLGLQVSHEGNLLRIELTKGGTQVFEATVPKQPAKRILGSVTTRNHAIPAWLTPTDEKRLDRSETHTHVCPPMQEAAALTAKAATLYAQAKSTGKKGVKLTDEARKALLKKADEADAIAKKETPLLYREVLKEFPEDPVIFGAILGLMRSAKDSGVKLDEVKAWGLMADKAAKAYGPRFEVSFANDAATVLADQEGFAKLAVDYARRVWRAQTAEAATTPPQDQIATLNLLSRPLRKAREEKEAKQVDQQIAKIEDQLDREYAATMPPFKGDAFPGRKSKSERVVFLEHFTNAGSRDSVAGDLACDVLQTTFKPSELVVIQYHYHLTDPLTNAGGEARLAYYQKAYPIELGSTPKRTSAVIFNGRPRSVGNFAERGPDGRIKAAELTYKAYRAVIEPLLEEEAAVKLAATAKRNGDKIDIQVNVSELAKPGTKKMLRIVLTEKTVRYLGTNQIRLHHDVARAFPGGVAGQPLTEAASKHHISISVSDLRGVLNKYLDNYQASVRVLKDSSRPLELERLRVIAFVQDDNTHEILQAVQVEVEGK